jgi:CrcB protein
MVETRGLLDGGRLASAGIYLLASVLLGVLAVLGGATLARTATRGRLRPESATTAPEPVPTSDGGQS